MSDFEIPDKLYFKIGEVAKITGVKAYVLRYWESEFRLIRPAKSRAGQRLYQRKDIEVLLQIRRLLYDEKYTIPGAKKQLRAMRGPEGKQQLALEFDDGGEPIVGHVEGGEPAPDEHAEVGEGGAEALAAGDLDGDHDPADNDDELDDDDDLEADGAAAAASPSQEPEGAALVLRDPTSMALVDQALREAEAILALVEEHPAVR